MNIEEWLGNDNQIGIDIWNKKYRNGDENFDQWLNRVSGNNEHIRQLILEKKFLFGGRILAGRNVTDEYGKKVSLSNCYVLPSPEDNLESIFDCAKLMARTYSYGGGCGTDLSKLAPRGAAIRNAAKTTSGAVSWMDLFSTTTASVCQSGRRGALMLTLNCDHPDIEEFVDAKMDLNKVTKANISIRFTNDFLGAAINQREFNTLYWRADTDETIIKPVDANGLLRKMAHNNWTMGEPGALFWDKIRDWNLNSNNREYKITSTNPCGEQPLPDGSACLLGSLNLAAFVEDGIFNMEDFKEAVCWAIIGLNEVLDEGIPLHPLQIQRDMARDWRNCGLGIMGLADMLIKMGIKYGSEESIDLCSKIAKTLMVNAIFMSHDLAVDQGAFPKCDSKLMARSAFMQNLNLDRDSLKAIEEDGLRNCALLTIAPTGTLSTMLGISGGIEPIFANSYTRKTESLNDASEPVYYKIYTPIVKEYMEAHGITDEADLPSYFITAHNINYHDRIKMQAAWQEYIDASISSTINLPNDATEEDIYNIYIEAWQAGLKGVTVYRDGCSRTGILTEKPTETTTTPIKIEIKDDEEFERGEIIPSSDNVIGLKRKLITGCGSLHCTTFFDNESGELREIYLSKGSTGGCNNFMIGLSRLISLAARGGVSSDDIIDQLMSTGVCPSYNGRTKMLHDTSPGSCCPMAVGYAVKDMCEQFKKMYFLKIDNVIDKTGNVEKKKTRDDIKIINITPVSDLKCPVCGSPMINEGGCNVCKFCGESKCS